MKPQRYYIGGGFGTWGEFYEGFRAEKHAWVAVSKYLKAGYGIVMVDRKTRREWVIEPPAKLTYSGPVRYPDMWGMTL